MHSYMSIFMMPVLDFPNSVTVEGIPLRGDFSATLVKQGTNFDEFRLNKDNDVIIATYPRSG